jgi:hypothetical protein
MNIEIDMTPADFCQLWNSHMAFGESWAPQIADGRFEELGEHGKVTIGTWWRQAYWLSDWAAVILARCYLAAKKAECAVGWDIASDEFVIFTHYDWRKADSA